VVAARIHLLSRNTEPSGGYSDPRTYRMGAVSVTPAAVSPAAAAYRRTLMTETVRLSNVADRHER
jgi:type IV pilus assembly protein PilW